MSQPKNKSFSNGTPNARNKTPQQNSKSKQVSMHNSKPVSLGSSYQATPLPELADDANLLKHSAKRPCILRYYNFARVMQALSALCFCTMHAVLFYLVFSSYKLTHSPMKEAQDFFYSVVGMLFSVLLFQSAIVGKQDSCMKQIFMRSFPFVMQPLQLLFLTTYFGFISLPDELFDGEVAESVVSGFYFAAVFFLFFVGLLDLIIPCQRKSVVQYFKTKGYFSRK